MASLLDLTGSYAVAELAVEEGDWVAGRTLADLALRDEGVAVLGMTRSDGSFRGAPVGPTLVHPGDALVLYGRGATLEEIDRRPEGPVGDRAHRAAVEHQWTRVAAEERRDTGGPGPSDPIRETGAFTGAASLTSGGGPAPGLQ